MTFTLIRLVMASLWIFSAYKWGDWKNWRKYYPTMLLFGMGDLIYYVVFDERLLWELEVDFLVPSLNELLIIFGTFFPTTLLFLSRFPKKGLWKKVVYFSLDYCTYFLDYNNVYF